MQPFTFSFSSSLSRHPHSYPLSLHDALPILIPPDPAQCSGIGADEHGGGQHGVEVGHPGARDGRLQPRADLDRKSTRLNSSHVKISYAVFCLKKKKKNNTKIIDKEK